MTRADELTLDGQNTKRHPLGGRNVGCLCEDPLPAGRLAAAIVDRLVVSDRTAAGARDFLEEEGLD